MLGARRARRGGDPVQDAAHRAAHAAEPRRRARHGATCRASTRSRARRRGSSRLGGGDGQLLERQSLTAPRTSLNGHISPHRRFSFGSVPLADVKAVKDAFGLTVNDVVMAICTGALRRWLIDHDELPEDPLLAMVPVSVRSEGQKGEFGNQVSVMVVPLPTYEPDPRRRLSLDPGVRWRRPRIATARCPRR